MTRVGGPGLGRHGRADLGKPSSGPVRTTVPTDPGSADVVSCALTRVGTGPPSPPPLAGEVPRPAAAPPPARSSPPPPLKRGRTGPIPTRVAAGLAALFFVALPLSTAAQEIALALLLAVAMTSRRRMALFAHPWAIPALAVAAVWVVESVASGNLHEGLGHAWLLAPLPAIAVVRERDTIERIGLGAACAAAIWGIAQRLGGIDGHGNFSHHLTLAYALLPPLGVAAARRRHGVTAILIAGVLATDSEGAVPALFATLAAARLVRPGWALAGGVVATLLLLGTVADPDELRQRAILWTGGLSLFPNGPVGPGGYVAASALAYDHLSPGFWFPNHAHDSGIEVLAVLGPAGFVAFAALIGAALGGADRGAAAGLAGVVVGAMTQDVFGDLEVARAAWAWIALTAVGNRDGSADTQG